LKICFISNCPRIGGAERVLLETIDVLSERGVECRVLLPARGAFADELSRRGISHTVVHSASLTCTGRPTAWQRLKAAVRFGIATLSVAREIAISRCDKVYSNTVTVGHGAVAAQLLGRNHIWHLHEFGEEDHGFQFYFGETFSCKTIGAFSTVCIAVSNALAAKYRPFIGPSKLVVVYPSMHLELERVAATVRAAETLPARNGQFRCIIVGGLCAGKRQEDAIRAFSLLQKDNVHADLVIVGESENAEYFAQLNRAIRENNLGERVFFTGVVRDARPFIQESDVLLVCSRSEAFGRVTIEAMLAGKPVIGSAAGATPELVQDGFSGMIYRVADAAALAENIRFLYHNRDAGRRFGENGKEWAQSRFTKERYSDELGAVLDRLHKPVETVEGSTI
jgi:glycosyltransferase involved in cell wall biosynthesis